MITDPESKKKVAEAVKKKMKEPKWLAINGAAMFVGIFLAWYLVLKDDIVTSFIIALVAGCATVWIRWRN